MLGLDPRSLEAYALNAAVVRWGTAFDAAIENATKDAKTDNARNLAVDRTVRRWLPETRRYADPTKR